MTVTDDNKCLSCKYYDNDEGVCGAFECYGIDCPILPCEEKGVDSNVEV